MSAIEDAADRPAAALRVARIPPDCAWRWAYPPDAELEAVAAGLVEGRVPDDAELIKESMSRRVWRAPRTAGGLILKHFKVTGWEATRSRVWPSRAGREYAIMTEFCRRGLPTVRPVAWGERREGGRVTQAWFLSTLVPGAVTLSAALRDAEEAGDVARRDGLMARGLAVIAELHRHPYNHRDLHAGNLLLAPAARAPTGDGADAAPDDRLLIIDLHSVWRARAPDRDRRASNLAPFLFSLRPYVDLDDPAALIAAYAAASGDDPAALAPLLRDAVDAFERDHVRGRTARCLRKSSRFTRGEVSAPGGRGRLFHRREYEPAHLRADLEEHGAVVAAGGRSVASGAPAGERNDRLLGDSARNRVTLVGVEAVGDETAGDDGNAAAGDLSAPRVVKTYRDTGPVAMLRACFGRGRARRAWVMGRRLEVLAIPTPRTLGLLERRDGTAVLVTAHEPGVTLRDHLATTPPPPERAGLARAVGWLVGRLARAGLRHHDLSAKNLLVSPEGVMPVGKDRRTRPPADRPHVLLIDLDGMAPMAPWDEDGLVRMLGQLGDLPDWVTRSDRQRFARAYRDAAGRDLPPAVLRAANERVLHRRARRRALIEERARGG